MAESMCSSSDTKIDVEACHHDRSSTSEKTSNPTSRNFIKLLSRGTPKWRVKLDTKVIYDAILGLSDGLTVPFALTAGLASVGSTRIVILGGLAELVAGAISMGLGGFVGSKSEAEAYETEVRKCDILIAETPDEVRTIISNHFQSFGSSEQDTQRIVDGLMTAPPSSLQKFLLTHHFETSKPDTSRPYISAVTLGLSYFLGGFIALIPYLCVRPNEIYTALWISVGVMVCVMFVFGYVKTCVVRGWNGRDNVLAGIRGAVQMLVIGALAVGAAVGLVRAIESGHHL